MKDELVTMYMAAFSEQELEQEIQTVSGQRIQ